MKSTGKFLFVMGAITCVMMLVLCGLDVETGHTIAVNQSFFTFVNSEGIAFILIGIGLMVWPKEENEGG